MVERSIHLIKRWQKFTGGRIFVRRRRVRNRRVRRRRKMNW
jgi:hypothetical protein